MQNRIKELERQNQELNSKVFELQALLDVVHSKKREVVIQTGQHQHILAGLKEKEQSDGTRVLPHIKSLEVGISSMSLDGDEIGSPEKSKSSDEDEDIAEVLDIIAQSEQSNNIRAGRARGSTVDELMGGPEQFIKARQFQEEQAKADLEQKNIELENAKKREEAYQMDLQKYIDQIAELRKRITEQDGIIKDQEKQIIELQLQLEELQNVIANLQSQTKKEKTENSEIDQEKMMMRQEMERLKKEIEDTKKESKETEDQFEKESIKLQAQLQTQRSNTQELRKETEQQKVAIAELESENAVLHKQLNALRLERINNSQEQKSSSVDVAKAVETLSNRKGSAGDTVIVRTDEELQLNLSSIELLLYRIAGNDMTVKDITQEEKIKKVCDMVLTLSKEIGDLMDRWLQKSKQQKSNVRLRSDKLVFQARNLIAQFSVCNNQLSEYEASNLNAIIHENRNYKKENKEVQKKKINVQRYRISNTC